MEKMRRILRNERPKKWIRRMRESSNKRKKNEQKVKEVTGYLAVAAEL